jgi:hypothetical protein
LCQDIKGSRNLPLFEYTREVDGIQLPVDLLRDADFIRFRFNLSELTEKIEARNYSVPAYFVEEAFETTMVIFKVSAPANFSCHQDPDCDDT